MTRVLSVIHHPSFGGPHNQVLRLDEPLRRRGFATLAVVPDEPGSAFERLRAGGVDVVRMRLGRLRARMDWKLQLRTLRTIAGDVQRLRSLIDSEGIDLVVLHGLANSQGAIAARLGDRPLVWQILDTRTPGPLRYALAPLVRGLSAAVMTTGRAVADGHPGVPHAHDRLFTYYPPVDTGLFAPDDDDRRRIRESFSWKSDDIVVGCVSNLTPQKRLETFVEVARAVSRAREEVRFAIFGAPMTSHEEYAAGLMATANDLVAGQRLLQVPVSGDVARHVRALDVFLGTAGPRSEGISTTILEAMSTGVPVVSTDVGAIREAVQHGENGFLVSASDSAELKRSVLRLVDDGALRARMGAASRERAIREFDVERCADVHARAFEAALSRGAWTSR
jgi:glycosyltransferase involved in cell wall biosynthesis